MPQPSRVPRTSPQPHAPSPRAARRAGPGPRAAAWAIALLGAALVACGGKQGTSSGQPKPTADTIVVESLTPVGTTDTRPIEVRFSQPIVEEADLLKTVSVGDVLTVSPAIPGEARWTARDTFQLVPSEPFLRATRYAVKVDVKKLPSGKRFAAGEAYAFNTPLLEVLQVQPFFRGRGKVEVLVNVTFSLPVKLAEAREAVRFTTSDGKPLTATLDSSADGETMAYRIDGVTVEDEPRTIQVRVASTLASVFGGAPLGSELVRDLVVAKPEALRVDQIYPGQTGGEYSIYLRFNGGVSLDDLKAVLSIKPAVKFSLEDNYGTYRVRGPFKPGNTFTVTIGRGLVGVSGGVLDDEISRAVVIADLDPEIRFSHAGSYLVRGGPQNVGLEVVNVQKLRMEVVKVFENNLVHIVPRVASRASARYCGDEGCFEEDGSGAWAPDYDSSYYQSMYDVGTFGSQVYEGEIKLPDKKNEWQELKLPFPVIDADKRPGLYRMRIMDAESGWRYVEKWVLSTDLGLVAKVSRGEARVQVVSLVTLKPAAGVDVRFVSSVNQLIGQAKSDAQGVASVSLAGTKPTEPLTMITASKDGDFSYLALGGTVVSTADFDVGGEGDSDQPYEAFTYLDRGVYRPGDKVRIGVIIRDRNLATPPPFPFTVEIRDPQWRTFTTLRGSTDKDGLSTFEVELPMDAKTGDYSAAVVGAGDQGNLGAVTIKVEEFMPDRIKVDVKPKQTPIELGETASFDVQSFYLFGPPAAGLRTEAMCAYALAPAPSKKFPAFDFGTWNQSGEVAADESLGDNNALDDAGHLELSCTLSLGEPPQTPVQATLIATVSENGGRAVTGVGTALIHTLPYYLGIRRNSDAYYAEVGKPTNVEVVAVDRDGNAVPGLAAQAKIVAVDYKTVVKLVNGRYQYVSEATERPVTTLDLVTKAEPATVPFTADRTGEYRIELTAGRAKARISFWVSGGGSGEWSMKKPNVVALTLDKPSYAPGSTANVMVRAPFSGQLYITVERDKVLWATQVELKGNSAQVAIPVAAAMGPNAYVVAHLARPVGSAEKAAPMRALGVAPLRVAADQHKLDVKLTAPEVMRPGGPLEVGVEVKGGKGAVQATVAVVDEGILRITRFKTPDPFAFFTRKKRLAVNTHDMLELVLPDLEGKPTALPGASGGDAARAKHLNPVSVKRVKPLALWSGVLNLDASGRGKVKLDVPQFQGAARVMLVAVEKERFGSGEREVTIRDPLVLTPTLPRFLAPLDRVEVPVEVFNGTGAERDVEVVLEVEGPVKIDGESKKVVHLADQAMGSTRFFIQADEVVGKTKITVRASAGGEKTFSETELAIRPVATTITKAQNFAVRAGKAEVAKLQGGFIPGTVRTRVTVGAAPAAQFGAALQYLIAYPYGCVEQTTSRAFPLVYLKDLARTSLPELAEDRSIDVYVNAAIGRLQTMLNPQGGLSYWPGVSYGYPWASVYGTHFLVEAKKAGYAVDERVLARLVEHLGSIASQARLVAYGNNTIDFESQAYALYVLALAGKPNASAAQYATDMVRRAVEKKLPPGVYVSTSEETRALLAGALILGGDHTRGSAFLGTELDVSRGKGVRGFWSPVRADALTLAVLADVKPEHKSVPKLMEALAKAAKVGRWYNTQENAYALLALGKIARALGTPNFTGAVKLGGKELGRFDHQKPVSFADTSGAWLGQDVELSIEGTGTAFATVTVEGIPAGLPPSAQNGLELTRTLHDLSGTTLDPTKITQGEVVVVRIDLRAPAASRLENVAVVDLLPAGLEIENPRLSNDDVASWMTKDRAVAEYVDMRDDRILMFLSNLSAGRTSLFYKARAVTQGEFVLPHVFAEAMYDPDIAARTGAGKLVVKGRE
jgi:uncharacterized protein YfaS (alpha-2-macroglobulin family)